MPKANFRPRPLRKPRMPRSLSSGIGRVTRGARNDHGQTPQRRGLTVAPVRAGPPSTFDPQDHTVSITFRPRIPNNGGNRKIAAPRFAWLAMTGRLWTHIAKRIAERCAWCSRTIDQPSLRVPRSGARQSTYSAVPPARTHRRQSLACKAHALTLLAHVALSPSTTSLDPAT